MRCREFQDKHLSFVDDTLSAVEAEAMRAHLEACPRCARKDTAIRRSLLVARNLPRIECSPDFSRRLEARLRDMGPINRGATVTPRTFGFAGFSILAGGIAAVAALAAFVMLQVQEEPALVRVAPVVASLPEPEAVPLTPAVVTPVYVASFINGMPVWPAVMAAGNAANVQLQQASLSSVER